MTDTTGRMQVFCGWCGIAGTVLGAMAMGPFGHFTPPVSPLTDAVRTAEAYRQNATGILIAGMLMVITSALSLVFVAGISDQIRRMNNSATPLLSYIQLSTGAIASFMLMLAGITWSVAAFRADRSPEIIQMLSDLATFFLFMPFSVGTMEAIAIAIAILSDRSPRPVFPRWIGVFTLIAGIAYLPGAVVALFKTGPLAWDGSLGFWAQTIVLVPWCLVMSACLIRAPNEAVLKQVVHA